MGLGRGHVQEVLDPSRPEADVAVQGCGRGWFWPWMVLLGAGVGRGSVLGMGAMQYRVLVEEAIISPTTAALWL